MRSIVYGNTFKKDYKKVNNYPSFKKNTFQYVVDKIVKGEKLDPKFKDHKMVASGVKYQGYRNCHIAPNICMIYDFSEDSITLIRIGSHSDLGLTESMV